MSDIDIPMTPVNLSAGGLYSTEYYQRHVVDSLASASLYLSHLWQYIRPDSVLDVGCGRGAWLKACHDLGSTSLIGFDGHWNRQSAMLDGAIVFQSIDLNKPFEIDKKVDLTLSLEVAEHLHPSISVQFVQCLTTTSDVILFGAAFPGQGGVNHINEQPPSVWAQLFSERDFFPVDLFRPFFWGDDRVCYWYRQNVFLYVRRGCEAVNQLTASGLSEIPHLGFMDCVHPILLQSVLKSPGLRTILRAFLPSLLRATRRLQVFAPR